MALKLSTGLANHLLDTGSLRSVLEGATLQIYSGTRPTSPDIAATGTKLVDITGLAFNVNAANGVLEKDPAASWAGTIANSGTASWFRIVLPPDTGATDSTTEKRVDGSIATSGADMNLSSTNFVAGAPFSMGAAAFTMPKG